jgi:hypothetical protein
MKKSVTILLLLSTIIFSGCTHATAEQKLWMENKTPLYTQRPIWVVNGIYKKNVFTPRRGYITVVNPFHSNATILDYNTKVFLLAFKGNVLFQHRGRKIGLYGLKVFDENGKFSKENNQKFISALFSPAKVDISNFTQLEKDAIEINEVTIGMSKEAVKVSIGLSSYPETFLYTDNKWYYDTKLLLVFKDNKIIKIKDNRILKMKEVG